MAHTGRTAILEWGLCAALLALGVLTALSVGFILLPVGLGSLLVVAWRNRVWPEALVGGMSGLAVASLIVALLNLGSVRCPPLGTAESGGQLSSCGGTPPLPWLLCALGLGAVAMAGMRMLGSGVRTGSPRSSGSAA